MKFTKFIIIFFSVIISALWIYFLWSGQDDKAIKLIVTVLGIGVFFILLGLLSLFTDNN